MTSYSGHHFKSEGDPPNLNIVFTGDVSLLTWEQTRFAKNIADSINVCGFVRAWADKLEAMLRGVKECQIIIDGDPRGTIGGDAIQSSLLDIIDSALNQKGAK